MALTRKARRTPLGTLAGPWYWLGYWIPCLVLGWIARLFVRRHAPHPVRVIAVLAPEHIGDLVFTSPLLRALRHRFPFARVWIAVTPATKPLVETCPYVDAIVAWKRAALGEALRVGFALRRRRVDVAIVSRADPTGTGAALAAVVSGAPQRLGLSDHRRPWRRLARLQSAPFLTDVVHPPPDATHEQQRRLTIAQHLGASSTDYRAETWITNANDRAAATFFSNLPSTGLRIAFGIGAAAANRRWPVQRFAEVITRLAVLGPIAPIIIAGPQDSAAVEQLRAATHVWAFALPGATLRESVALLRRCVLFVGNDSGPAHLASASSVPAVVISAHPIGAEDVRHPSHPAKCGPAGDNSIVLRPPHPTSPMCAKGCVVENPHCILGVNRRPGRASGRQRDRHCGLRGPAGGPGEGEASCCDLCSAMRVNNVSHCPVVATNAVQR